MELRTLVAWRLELEVEISRLFFGFATRQLVIRQLPTLCVTLAMPLLRPTHLALSLSALAFTCRYGFRSPSTFAVCHSQKSHSIT